MNNKQNSKTKFLDLLNRIKNSQTSVEREVILADGHEYFSKFSNLITTVVMIAPLLGLLGTVSGMIETFASLGDGALHSQSGGIAGGISTALISTQMGLAVAIPGLVIGRILVRKQQRLMTDLEQAKEKWRSIMRRFSQEEQTQVDISPLIDMVFILLIFLWSARHL